LLYFFFQAEDGIRDRNVTGVQTCALPIYISLQQTEKVIELLEQGSTVPFIARYRKDVTGSLDEVQIKAIEDSYQYITNLEQRKEDVLKNIEEQGKLTEQLKKDITAATVLQRVEDLYRPFMQKRRTRATIAKEKGLEPRAIEILKITSTANEEIAKQ